ncbi:D-2-hydroxyacid dehydrogenase [Oceanibacterium hippocampi]|uniref:(S)-sulfolactate dehydrogenase n=1 Tax=Oceanibacterium hippocampi TaxID=745714 RepID=A0A1Y5S8L6_9PROT|nr:D-2-hydroxyacid dehydrogenase [Oceanibacterium hippocampi]SLN34930.1 (S)-sulfolactate dehydrogenase [Oceanibacterium hippocampi]
MTKRTRVLLWTDTPAPYLDAISAAGLAERVTVDTLPRNETPSAQRHAGTEVLVAWRSPPGILAELAGLRWVQAMTAGVDSWLRLPDLRPGVTLTCARGTHRESMPENILGALFHLTKPFAAIVEDQKTRTWTSRIAESLNGRTLGILGLGAIGQDLARLAAMLGMRVIGTKRVPADLPGVAEVYPPERTDAVLADSDFVLLLLPATPATENFIDAGRLALMKPTAWLLNFGRGHLVVDDDLIAAVEGRRIAGAMLDVFRQEPLPREHPFWGTPGIIVLPHVGGMHPERDRTVARLFVDNLRRFLDGEPLTEIVDRAVGY